MKLNLIIDGDSFSIDIFKLSRSAKIKTKVQAETEDGGIYREMIGTMLDIPSISFGIVKDLDEYTRLFDKLIEPVQSHTITLPINDKYNTFVGYVDGVADEVDTALTDKTRFKSLVCSFVSTVPILKAEDFL